jgi:hypothetical protein
MLLGASPLRDLRLLRELLEGSVLYSLSVFLHNEGSLIPHRSFYPFERGPFHAATHWFMHFAFNTPTGLHCE